MSKFVVIFVGSDREVFKVGQTDTLPEAQQMMKEDFKNLFCQSIDNEEDFENEFLLSKERGDCEIGETYAWLNYDIAFDWKIFEVDC